MCKISICLIILIASNFSNNLFSQENYSLTVKTRCSREVSESFKSDGRIFLFISNERRGEPRFNTWPNINNKIFATNLIGWKPDEYFTFDEHAKVYQTVDISLGSFPEGSYRMQILWDQDRSEPNINAPGNLHSIVMLLELKSDTLVDLPLKQIIQPVEFRETDFLKEVMYESNILSAWWGKPVKIRAAVLLPSGFNENPGKKYPVRYNIAGYGGRYTRALSTIRNKAFSDWWLSDDAPQIITVYLDGYGPFGDCYQLDSENSGPYGTALIQEFIPHVEKKFRAMGTPESRFLDGCSTGGWVSLALQVFYPDFFNGCWSFSPDPVDFEYNQLVNIYKDDNAFVNEYGYLRPLVRDIYGEPIISQKDFIRYENVLGESDTYLNSGMQFSAFTALYSPRGENGLPKPLFDPETGKIDHEVAEFWRKHDLKDYVMKNWKELGPKLNGKIQVWMGDMDNFYLNPAMRSFDKMIKSQNNPESDALIIFSPMEGHCSQYSQKEVLVRIAEKISALGLDK